MIKLIVTEAKIPTKILIGSYIESKVQCEHLKNLIISKIQRRYFQVLLDPIFKISTRLTEVSVLKLTRTLRGISSLNFCIFKLRFSEF